MFLAVRCFIDVVGGHQVILWIAVGEICQSVFGVCLFLANPGLGIHLGVGNHFINGDVSRADGIFKGLFFAVNHNADIRYIVINDVIRVGTVQLFR